MSLLRLIPYIFSGSLDSGTDPDPDPDPGTGEQIGEIWKDTFAGSSLSSLYDTPIGATHTIAVASNKVRVTGTDTSNNAARKIRRSTYYLTSGSHTQTSGVSTLRAIDIYTDLKAGSYGTSGSRYGAYIGARSESALSLNSSTFGRVNYESNKIQIVSGNSSDAFVDVLAEAAITVTLNLAHDYKLTLSITGTDATLILLNKNTSESQYVTFGYEFTIGNVDPHHPSAYKPCFGVAGTSDIYFTNFGCSSTEYKNHKGTFQGDSIIFGYDAVDAEGFTSILLTKTTDAWSIAGAPGQGWEMLYYNIPEIIARNPEYLIGLIGTNDSAGSVDGTGAGFDTAFTVLEQIDAALVAAGINTKWLTVPNGGNPATTGNYNNKIMTKDGGTKGIDIFTTGWSTMSTGNGEMADSIHPTLAGSPKLADIVQDALPTLFPL